MILIYFLYEFKWRKVYEAKCFSKRIIRLQLFCKRSQGQVREYGHLLLLPVCAVYLVGTLLSPQGTLLHLPQSARKYSSPPVPQPPMPQVGCPLTFTVAIF